MKIHYILLKNFKRMPLSESDTFEHQFNSKLTIITGPNGCGKSSLFNELTPLPSERSNFNENGYKEIHIEKDKKFYKLISDFTEGAKYYFLVDGENLNLSHNVTTQRELVFKHFGITQNIHNILIGIDTFTDMSVVNRKKLFNSITNLNIDAVIENYNHLKEERKKNEFLLKTQTSLLQAEEQKLINKDHLKNLINYQEQIKKYIDILLDIRANIYSYKNSTKIDEAASNYLNIFNKIKSIISKYYTYLTSYSADNRAVYKSKLELVNYKLDKLYSLLESKEKDKAILNLNKQNDLNTLKKELQALKDTRDKILSSLQIFKSLQCPVQILRNDILKLEVSLFEVIRTIPLNENRRFSREKYEKLLATKEECLNELNKCISKEAKINRDIEHLLSHKKDVVCPKCSYAWTLLDTDVNLEKLKQEREALLEKILKLKEKIEKTDKGIAEITEYFSIYKQYSALRKATLESLKPFWDIVDKNEYIFKNPTEIGNLFRLAVVEIENLVKTQEMRKTIDEMQKNIEILSKIKDTSIENLELEIKEINEKIAYLQLEKDELNSHIKNNEVAMSATKLLTTAKDLLDNAQLNLQSANISHTVEEVLSVVETELSKYKVALIETEREVSNYNNIKYTVDKYKNVVEDIESNIKVLDIILNELSPKNGLIARSVSSFLNIIIENINKIISAVWNYKMVLKAINVENDILNYKFKVEVENKITIDDISKCSAGMRKIINFSFVKLLYKLLKFENYPLFLDEFTTNLDSLHTQKFAQLVNNLIMTENYSQVFIISHINSDFYFSSKNAEILELGN